MLLGDDEIVPTAWSGNVLAVVLTLPMMPAVPATPVMKLQSASIAKLTPDKGKSLGIAPAW